MNIRKSLLGDLLSVESDLHGVVQDGLKLFVERHGSTRAGMSQRSQASIIHDCMVEEAKKRFPWKQKKNLFLLVVKQYRIKLKKLDDRLRSKNYPTQLVFRFLSQARRLFDDDEGQVNLHLGYQPDAIDLTKSSCWITLPRGRSIDWAYEFPDAAASPLAFPAQPAPTVTPRKSRVLPKKKHPETGLLTNEQE